MSTYEADQWLKGLNPEQQEAVLHNEGPLLILAGAGSGKTTVLVTRTGRLIGEGQVKPEQVTVLTFTNKAARELKERVATKLGREGRRIWAGTFHSFGLSILRQHHRLAQLPQRFGIVDSGDARAIVRELLKDLNHSSKDDFDTEKLLSLMGVWREKGQMRAKTEDPYEEITQLLLPRYLKRLELLGVVDFDGLLLKPLELFKEHPTLLEEYQNSIRQLMVDEFQDTNAVQLKLVQALAGLRQNVTVVGDDDQSIYGWRGACVSNILDFPHLYQNCKVVRLERNYRSKSSILDLANEVIQKNKKRHNKILKASAYSEKGKLPEVFVFENEEDEAEEVAQQIHHFLREGHPAEDIAILYRSNSQGGLLEGVLRRHQIPYSLTGGSTFFERREVKDVLAYIRCAVAPHEVAYRRILNTPPRGIGEVTVKKLEAWSHVHRQNLWESARHWREAGVLDRQGQALSDLFEKLTELKEELLNVGAAKSTGEKLMDFFARLGYRDFMRQHYKDSLTAQKRWELIDILGRVLDGFFGRGGKSLNSLREFIDAMDLRDSVDESSQQKEKSRVQLLTLHACKGLEFPLVFIVGLEEDILPHRTLGLDIDEERRLFYVGITRAKEQLILSRCRQRKRYGQWRPVSPSRFLVEIPERLTTVYEEGVRPVSESDRQSMLADLYKKLDRQAPG